MDQQYTTYTVKSKLNGFVWLFKYHLNGTLHGFTILDSELTPKQEDWLKMHFPFNEMAIQEWMQKLTDNFIITKGEPVLDFEAMWQLYDHKVAKQDALKSYNKLKPGEILKAFIDIPLYLQELKKNPGIGKLHLATYLNKRRFDDERPQKVGKNFNPVLHNLAKKKTDK